MKTRVKHKTQNTSEIIPIIPVFPISEKIILYKYIQKMFLKSVLGTAQLQFENILKLKITESF